MRRDQEMAEAFRIAGAREQEQRSSCCRFGAVCACAGQYHNKNGIWYGGSELQVKH